MSRLLAKTLLVVLVTGLFSSVWVAIPAVNADEVNQCVTTTEDITPLDEETDQPIPDMEPVEVTTTVCPRDTSKEGPHTTSPDGTIFDFFFCSYNQGARAFWSSLNPGIGGFTYAFQYIYQGQTRVGAVSQAVACNYLWGCDFTSGASRASNRAYQTFSAWFPGTTLYWGGYCY